MHKMSLLELLEFIQESILLIQRRFSAIDSIDDFMENDDGLEKLDSIIMRIQAIGEALKNINKHQTGFLEEQGSGDNDNLSRNVINSASSFNYDFNSSISSF